MENLTLRPSEILAARRDQVLLLALARGASRVRVFGSVAKGIDRQDSDIDLLVGMPAGTSMLKIVGLQIELEDALGTWVDLCTEQDLPLEIRMLVLAEALAI